MRVRYMQSNYNHYQKNTHIQLQCIYEPNECLSVYIPLNKERNENVYMHKLLLCKTCILLFVICTCILFISLLYYTICI